VKTHDATATAGNIITRVHRRKKKKKNGSAQIRTATFKYILFDKNIPNVQAITPQGP
jgi:hypothetical protein